VGVDLGTSGCRALAIDARGRVRAQSRAPLRAPRRRGSAVEQDPQLWWEAVAAALRALFAQSSPAAVAALAVDATSGTVLLADAAGRPLGPALMYNDARATAAAARVERVAPPEAVVHGPTSGLAKILHLQRLRRGCRTRYALSQADWITGRLAGSFGVSDDNNSLKLGFDPVSRSWPPWIEQLGLDLALLPVVARPGTTLARVGREAQEVLGLPPTTLVAAGTTDSTAGFLAAGAQHPGEGVTSLGSTLVVKVLSPTPLFAAQHGVYSQPLGSLWLAGGGSNTGGAVLRHYFRDEEIDRLSRSISPDRPSGLDYYPLVTPGERFPVNDPRLPARLSPRPADDRRFLHGLLEGIAAVEARGYRLLTEIGAPKLRSVRSIGGGASNAAWLTIRAHLLGVPLLPPLHTEAAYGAALLARQAARREPGRSFSGVRPGNAEGL
jgi:sugar (pentulose or hexulose) kinase